MSSFTVGPQVVAVTTPISVTFNGTGTSWATATPSFSPSAGSLGTLTVNGNTTASATFTPPSTPQAVTFTEGTSGNTFTVSVVALTMSVSPSSFNKSTATPLIFTYTGTQYTNTPTVTVTAGTLTSVAVSNLNQVTATFTPSATLGSVTFNDTTSSLSCTGTVVQTLAVSPSVCPTSATAATVQLAFISYTAGWTAGTLPTITPSAGSLGALTYLSSSICYGTYTPPSTAQTVTFTDSTDGSITASLAVVATNVYTYTLQDMLNAGIFHGRWSTQFKFNQASTLLFSASAPYSVAYLTGLSGTAASMCYAGASGNLWAPANVVCPSFGSPVICPLYANATEAAYNIAAGLATSGSSGYGWNTVVGSAGTKNALVLYSTSATKPTLQPYVDNYKGTGASVTWATPPAPLYSADSSMSMAGNSQVSPTVLSGEFAAYGMCDLAQSATQSGQQATEHGPNLAANILPSSSTSGIFGKARFRATTQYMYALVGGINPIANTPGGVLAPLHLSIDQAAQSVDIVPTTPAVGNGAMQWIPIAGNLDGSNDHEYSLHLGSSTSLIDRVMVPGGSFTKKPVRPRLAGGVIGDSHTQGEICWECWGSAAGAYPRFIGRRNGIDMVNLGISGNKVAQLARLYTCLNNMPVLANGVVGQGFTPPQLTATVSGGAITALTINAGGANIPGSSMLATILSTEGGAGAEISLTISSGVVTGYTIVSGGTGYTTAPSVFAEQTVKAGVAGKGVMDFIAFNMGYNDSGTTARATGRQQVMTGIGIWLTTCPGPLILAFPYGTGNPWVNPVAAPFTTGFGNYDILLTYQALKASRPDLAARVILADISTFDIATNPRQCGGTTSTPGSSNAPAGWGKGGHLATYTYDQLALALDPYVKTAISMVTGANADA